MARVWKFLFSFAIFVTVCAIGLFWFVNHEVAKGVNQAVADTPGLALSYADLSVSIADHSVRLDNVEAMLPDGRHFTAESVSITAFDQANPVPHFVSGQATGVVMESSFDNFGEWAEALVAMGKESVTGDVALDYRFDPETRTLTINTLTIKADELGDAKLSGVVDQLDLAALHVEKLLGLRVATADLKFTNRSLMKTILRSAANNLGSSQSAARAQIGAELTAMADYADKNDNPVAEKALRGLKQFLDTPETITISARPAEPVPVLFFFMGRDFYDNLRLLNISVTTEESDDI